MKEGGRKRVPGQSHSRKRGRRGRESVPEGRKEGEDCAGWTWESGGSEREAHADRRPQTGPQTGSDQGQQTQQNERCTRIDGDGDDDGVGGCRRTGRRRAGRCGWLPSFCPVTAAEACRSGREEISQCKPCKTASPPHHRHFINGRGARKGGRFPLALARGGA